MSAFQVRKLDRLAYSISEFCELVGVSRNYYYTLSESARPRSLKIGGRTLIPADAINEWLKTSGAAA